MNFSNPYIITILISSVVIISFLFSRFSRRTNIPSAILLIIFGVGIKLGMDQMEITTSDRILEVLELLGVVGLIMIVLEAALDLKLSRDKRPLIVKSLLVALVSLMVCSFSIAWILDYFVIHNFFQSLFYAIPLSIMSSAIIIPSVGSLREDKKEFLIYESTFSDIFGIMFFYFLSGYADSTNTGEIVMGITGNIVITILVSIVISYAMVLLLQTLKEKVKLFFLIALLIVLYSAGKMLHMSSLLIILVFGLVLNNYQLFFRGKLQKLIKGEALNHVLEDFHVVTLESAFVIRTFFFVIFGITLDLASLNDINTAIIGVGITLLMYLIRFVFLKSAGLKSIMPELLIAPRGLITVLLFFSIPADYLFEGFNPGILLYTIILTNIAMSAGLIFKSDDAADVDQLHFPDINELDEELLKLKSKN
jgi:Kef-type K+ transport system membrane component KefB